MLVLISVLVAIAALFGWLSARVLRLPNTIGTMLLMAITSIGLELLAPVWPGPHHVALQLLGQINFERLMVHGMLPLLLFAGAFLLDLEGLLAQRLPVALLAFVATVISTLGVGMLTYFAGRWCGLQPTMLESLLFGALISPTDPIAVLEMLRRVHAPLHLESQLAGESLFNDGVGAVIFIALLGATRGVRPSALHIILDIVLSAGGGMLLGAAMAVPIALLMRSVHSPAIDILLSLALALGGYVIAGYVGVSAPLATVASALALRVFIAHLPKDVIDYRDLNYFWTNLDEIQNAILFVLLGCGFLLLVFYRQAVLLGLLELVIVNAVRVGSVAIVLWLLKWMRSGQRSSLTVLSWGGLRGGLSIALALSVPAAYGERWIVSVTYVLVVFSVLAQGTTMGRVLKRFTAGPKSSAKPVETERCA
jgi:CPA1 family monovalent cation:H+ antiporter